MLTKMGSRPVVTESAQGDCMKNLLTCFVHRENMMNRICTIGMIKKLFLFLHHAYQAYPIYRAIALPLLTILGAP